MGSVDGGPPKPLSPSHTENEREFGGDHCEVAKDAAIHLQDPLTPSSSASNLFSLSCSYVEFSALSLNYIFMDFDLPTEGKRLCDERRVEGESEALYLNRNGKPVRTLNEDT